MPRRKRKATADHAEERIGDDVIPEARLNPPRKSKRLANKSSVDVKAAETAVVHNHEEREQKQQEVDDQGTSSESDWEEVAENEDGSISDDREPIIPKEGVEFTMEAPASGANRKKKKQFDLQEYFRKQMNKYKRETQESLHKVHLLCLLARGLHVNAVVGEEVVRAVALSVLPTDLFLSSGRPRTKNSTMKGLKRLQAWCRSEGFLEDHASACAVQEPSFTVDSLLENFDVTSKSLRNSSAFRKVIVVAVFLRTAGYDVRIVFSLQPTPLRLATQSTLKKECSLNDDQKAKAATLTSSILKITEEKLKTKKKDAAKEQTSQTEATSSSSRRTSLRQCRKLMNLKESDSESAEDNRKAAPVVKKTATQVAKNEEDHEDFKVEFVKINNPGPLTGTKRNRKTLSSDSDEEFKASMAAITNDCWLEVFIDELKEWLCVDPVHGHIGEPHKIEKSMTQPIKYVVAFDGDGHLKDVTKRYASGWLSHTRKLRVAAEWWTETLQPFRGPSSKRDLDENNQLDKNLKERPLPTSISEYKSHPLYALKRHLLKFEGIYPPDAVPVGFIRSEPVYPRHCIRELHSRETWLKEARLVRIGETPYKVVKARPKWNKAMGELQSDLLVDLFGEWQTEDYIPPAAKDGKVPRNEYGNVELFKPCMLPAGTVHLQISGLNRVARKLNIDCAQAMTGWDFHGVGSHPIFDGWIVCEEFKDVLLDAWNEEQVIINQREQEKREKRVYGNWRRIIRGLLIRERLQIRYGSSSAPPEEEDAVHTEKSPIKRRRNK